MEHWHGPTMCTSLQGLQDMVNICQKHAEDTDLVLSTDKADPAKSIAFNCEKWKSLPPIFLNGDPLPWKESVKHIGSVLNCDATMVKDNREKRGIFIQTCMNLNQEFETLPSESQLKLFKLYNTHFTGSNCWDYQSNIFQQLVNSYNVNLKCIFNLPWGTHTWLTEELSEGNHAQVIIYKRFVKFVQTLVNNKRQSLKTLFKYAYEDVRSLIGGNLRKIQLVTGIKIVPGVTAPVQLRNCRIYKAPEGEEWRLPLLQSLLEIRSENWEILFNEELENYEGDDISTMIEEVCST